MENNPYRKKTLPSSGSAFIHKVQVMKNDRKIPNNMSKRNILRDIDNIRHKSPSDTRQSKTQQGSSTTVHPSSSLPAQLSDDSASNKTYYNYSSKYGSEIPRKNNYASVSGEASRSVSSTPPSTSARELLETVLTNLAGLQKQNEIIIQEVRENKKLISGLLRQQHTTVATKPTCLPFHSLDDLLQFNKTSNENYVDVVNFLAYLGGLNATDSAAKYFRYSFTVNENLLSNITWTGSKKDDRIIALGETRFAAACEEAMASNRILLIKPTNYDFVVAMNKALKSIKERLRRRLQQRNGRRTFANGVNVQEDEVETDSDPDHRRTGVFDEEDDRSRKTDDSEDLFNI